MDDRLGAGLGDDPLEELAVLDRADIAADLVSGDLAPGGDPSLELEDRGQLVAADPLDPAAADEVVDDRDLVSTGREPQGGRPAEVAIATEDQHSHSSRQGIGGPAGRAHSIAA